MSALPASHDVIFDDRPCTDCGVTSEVAVRTWVDGHTVYETWVCPMRWPDLGETCGYENENHFAASDLADPNESTTL